MTRLNKKCSEGDQRNSLNEELRKGDKCNGLCSIDAALSERRARIDSFLPLADEYFD